MPCASHVAFGSSPSASNGLMATVGSVTRAASALAGVSGEGASIPRPRSSPQSAAAAISSTAAAATNRPARCAVRAGSGRSPSRPDLCATDAFDQLTGATRRYPRFEIVWM